MSSRRYPTTATFPRAENAAQFRWHRGPPECIVAAVHRLPEGHVKRIGAVVVLLILSAAGLLWPVIVASIPASSSAASDPVSIVDYSARYDIQVDGHLSAVETITAQFPSGRHGIFRYWDVTNPTDSGARQIPTVSSVTLDGRDVPVEYSTESAERYVVAKIGDPNSYVSQGVHVYEISYTVEGVIDPPSAGAGDFATVVGDASASAQSVFYWNVVAPGWEMPIRQANVVVTLPAPSGRVECSADDRNAQPCAVGGEGTDVVTIAASDLDPRQPVTVRIGMNLPAPARDILPWSSSFDKVLGRSPPWSGCSASSAWLPGGCGRELRTSRNLGSR